MARYNADGDLVVIGREDFRVKIFGQLVVPEEIEEAVIRASEHVETCVVRKETGMDSSSGDDDQEYLSCHVLAPSIPPENHIDFICHLEKFCRRNLASFMIPAAWKVYDTFSYLSTGKVDRNQFSKLQRTDTLILSAKSLMDFK